jgi:hypothetical protein
MSKLEIHFFWGQNIALRDWKKMSTLKNKQYFIGEGTRKPIPHTQQIMHSNEFCE